MQSLECQQPCNLKDILAGEDEVEENVGIVELSRKKYFFIFKLKIYFLICVKSLSVYSGALNLRCLTPSYDCCQQGDPADENLCAKAR